MFKIIKKGSNNFWHVFNNGAKNVSISDFEVVLDDVLNTFVIVLRNGANIPQIALSVLDIIVIDETASSVEETFLTASQLRARLVVLGYTAYLGAGNADAITGLVEAGTNVTITGTGTLADPYVISSSGGSGTTPTLQEVTDAGNEIINTAGNFKIVLDVEYNGMFLYELVSGTWENRGYYNNQGFTLGDWGGNTIFDLNIYTGLLSIYNGSDIVQFSPTSATKNGVEFATEDYALKRDGSNASADIDVASVGYSVSSKYLKVGSPTTQMEVISENLTTNRTAKFQDKNYTGIADITDIPDISTKQDTLNAVNFGSFMDLILPVKLTPSLNDFLAARDYLTNEAVEIPFSTIQPALGFIPDKPTSLMSLNSDYTGTTSTSLQKAFNVGSSGNGSFPAVANKKYAFEYILYLDGLSSTSGTISFGILGTATIDFIFGNSIAKKTGTPSSAAASQSALINSTTQAVVTATTTTNGYFCIIGELTTTSSGTLIPAFAVSQSTTPTIKKGSFFRIKELGANTINATSDIV